jgi:ATP-binding cassette subfamily B protein/subfamily B ATP-binding cassette protein MsbA
VLCGLAVGVLWGANFGTVYPFVEVVLKGRTLRQWVDAEIEKAETKSADLAVQINDLQKQRGAAAAGDRDDVDLQIAKLQSRRDAEQAALATRQWLKPYIYNYLPVGLFSTLVLLVGVMLAATLVKSFFLSLSCVLSERVTHLGSLQLRKDFFRRTLRMELASFNESGTSDLMSRFTHDIQQVNLGLRVVFGKAIREPLKMIACFIGAGLICWRLLFLSLVLAPIAGYLIALLGKSVKRANRRAMEEMSLIYNALSEAFRGIKVVKAFTMERHERRNFHDANKVYFRKAMRIALYDSLIRPATELMGMCTISLAILCGAYLVLNQETHLLGLKMTDRPLDINSMLMFFAFLAGVSDPARKLSDVFARLQQAVAGADRIYQKLDREPAIRDPDRPMPAPRHHRDIVFENVHFHYATGEEVLDDINLTIPFDQTLAIVGPNGCGKSTLANLIARFFDPTSGNISVDGVNLRDVRVRDHRSQIGLVTQETLLFNDTVEANIRYGKIDATHDEVVEAAKRAHAHSFIENRLEHGYDTVVGENASRISGGQRQRIALARAILRDPRILLLDEATSQVDLESEQVINRVLAEFMRNRTAVIITHRPSLLELADRILVMEAGRIIDVGTHGELTGRCALYRRLYQLDFRASA